MKLILLCISLCLIFFTTVNAQENIMTYKYSILLTRSKNPDLTLPNIHPCIEEAKDDFVMVSVHEDDLLKVAFYDPDLKLIRNRFEVHNPERRDFTGMPAKYLAGVDYGGVVFADGTVLKPYLPPDARPIGSNEWPYEMRWRRVYKNYYYVTKYRGAGVIGFEHLVTEKDGQDLSPILGESSVTTDSKKFSAAGGGGSIGILYPAYHNGRIVKNKLNRMDLVPVYEKDLPPDFPKGLVRWIP